MILKIITIFPFKNKIDQNINYCIENIYKIEKYCEDKIKYVIIEEIEFDGFDCNYVFSNINGYLVIGEEREYVYSYGFDHQKICNNLS